MMSNDELAAKVARYADRVMAARLYAATPDCKASRELIAAMRLAPYSDGRSNVYPHQSEGW